MNNPVTFGQRMAQVDHIADYVPVMSTITNIINIFQKLIIDIGRIRPNSEKDHYFHHIKDKSYGRCFFAALLPVIGNIILGIYDYRKGKSESEVSGRPPSTVIAAPSSGDESDSTRLISSPQGEPEVFDSESEATTSYSSDAANGSARVNWTRRGPKEKAVKALRRAQQKGKAVLRKRAIISDISKHRKSLLIIAKHGVGDAQWIELRKQFLYLEVTMLEIASDEKLAKDPTILLKQERLLALRQQLTESRRKHYAETVQSRSDPILLIEALAFNAIISRKTERYAQALETIGPLPEQLDGLKHHFVQYSSQVSGRGTKSVADTGGFITKSVADTGGFIGSSLFPRLITSLKEARAEKEDYEKVEIDVLIAELSKR